MLVCDSKHVYIKTACCEMFRWKWSVWGLWCFLNVTVTVPCIYTHKKQVHVTSNKGVAFEHNITISPFKD